MRTGLIHSIVVIKFSVDHLYKWALRMVERCVHGAAPGQPKGGKRRIIDTTEIMIAALSHVQIFILYFSWVYPIGYIAIYPVGYLLFL